MRNKKRDEIILKVLTGTGFLMLPILVFRKQHFKDWLLIFFLKGVYISILDSFVVQKKWVSYPIRPFKKSFKISTLFDYLLFPVTCILYNQVTYHSKLLGILGKAFFFSIPMTVLEFGLVKKTNLVKWKNWTWYKTLISLTLTFWLDRVLMILVRKVSNTTVIKPEPPDHEEH